MSQSAKRIKLEPDANGNEQRKEDKNSLISGQFMTSSLDNDPGVKRTSSRISILNKYVSSRMLFHVLHLFQMQYHKIYLSLMKLQVVIQIDE
jgi:hypothetical protein